MFTGIIRYTGQITGIKSVTQGKRLQIKTDSALTAKLEKGISSIAIDGSCHTVEEFDKNTFTVFSSFETLQKTTLASVKSGGLVNLELSLTPDSLLDGHIVQGHVDGTGRISSIRKKGEAYLIRFTADHSLLKYLVEKDSIAVDGVSLTLFNIDESTFQTAVIPETAINTTLLKKPEGSLVNIEVNILAKYAKKFLNLY